MSLVLGLVVTRVTTKHLRVKNVFAARDVRTAIFIISLLAE